MNYLQSEQSWTSFVNNLDFSSRIKNKEEAKKALEYSILTALKPILDKGMHRVDKGNAGSPYTALLFSGGIDSTLIAFLSKKLGYNLLCYAFGFKDSPDILAARAIAKEYKFQLKEHIIKEEELEPAIKTAIEILKTNDITKVSIGALIVIACQSAKQDGVKTLLTGSGTEDTLAGYQKHSKALAENRLAEELKQGLLTLYERDLSRDLPIAKHFNIELDSPYLDENYIKTALSIDNKFKINNQHRKLILREIALDLGIKEEFSFRKKVAAQYGSRILKEMDKLARKQGFKNKEEYLKFLME
ncbi:MAG TPA: asparagine synthase-related protein [Candidatus Nanoarchaeia archaeon]|nr:asparagine synthase-related protein [Candidatus Nanoarchaeia archaeon]